MLTDEMAQRRLLYVLEQTRGLSPELSRCAQCAHVEYIYFTGIVCTRDTIEVDGAGRCRNFMPQ